MSDTNPIASLTTQIVGEYVTKNKIAFVDLPDLIGTVHKALASVGAQPAETVEATAKKPTAAQIRKSLTPDKIISFIDGKGYSVLKRHLTTNGMTPATYREAFGLPADYPMTSRNYTLKRSRLALEAGLGQKAPLSTLEGAPEAASGQNEAVSTSAVVAGEAAPSVTPTDPPKRGRGRPKLVAPAKAKT